MIHVPGELLSLSQLRLKAAWQKIAKNHVVQRPVRAKTYLHSHNIACLCFGHLAARTVEIAPFHFYAVGGTCGDTPVVACNAQVPDKPCRLFGSHGEFAAARGRKLVHASQGAFDLSFARGKAFHAFLASDLAGVGNALLGFESCNSVCKRPGRQGTSHGGCVGCKGPCCHFLEKGVWGSLVPLPVRPCKDGCVQGHGAGCVEKPASVSLNGRKALGHEICSLALQTQHGVAVREKGCRHILAPALCVAVEPYGQPFHILGHELARAHENPAGIGPCAGVCQGLGISPDKAF